MINEYFVVYCNVALTINGNVREKQFESKKNLGRVFYIMAAVCVFLHVVILSLSFFDNNQQENIAEALFRTGNTRQMRITAGLYFQHKR